MPLPEPDRPVLLRRAQAVAEGYTDAELARMVRRKKLSRLQRGTYAEGSAVLPVDPAARHALVVLATIAGLRSPAIVSHESAAVLHQLPVWGIRLGRVHILRPPPARGTGSSRVHLHVAKVPDDQLVLAEGLLATDVTRTIVDVARTAPFESAVVMADRALHTRSTSRAALEECLGLMGPVPGRRAAARVIAFADPLSESVGESRSRVLVHRLRLPVPDLQVRVLRQDGSEIGRCDFGWKDRRTVGEFDGQIKYGRLLRPGQSPGDVVFEEKLREDELRDHRWQVARWTWHDLDRGSVVEQRIRRSFARGAG
ncbi:CTP synthase [Blastococcus jejuensis]|uniref:CTP synthase n=1 Tax=Blastococcus jejuensis TaxID=351224 RepID=A0ABP6PA00_9ACTN